MRLLIVAVANSVHTANYLRLLEGTGWQVEVFDSQYGSRPHPDLPAVRVHTAKDHRPEPEDAFTMEPPQSGNTPDIEDRAVELAELIREYEPDLVHSHEIQHSGATVDLARRDLGGSLPCPWLQTSWGSDIYMYSRHPNYVDRIRSVMGAIDYFNAECHRDVALARAMGFRGRAVGVWPVVGGFDVAHVQDLAVPGKVSARRSVAVKGALGSIARGEIALDALDLVGEKLDGYEVCTYQTSIELEDGFRRVIEGHGGTYRRISSSEANSVPHDEILALHGRSRVSLALNNSDGMSTSFMEAMTAGSFPVHSKGSCGREVAPDGRGAIFVSATDPGEVAQAVIRALTDDELVDAAGEMNMRTAAEHFERGRIRARILDMYERICDEEALAAFS